MNHDHLNKICSLFKLGTCNNKPVKMTGGLLHTVWQIETNIGSYVIKELSHDIDLNDLKINTNYELSESIASEFSNYNIPIISALKVNNKHLINIDDKYYLIYPYASAKAFDEKFVSEYHAIKIAKLLAQIHKVDLQMSPSANEMNFIIKDDMQILNLIMETNNYNLEFNNHLNNNLDKILKLNLNYCNAIPLLKKNTLISHGDLDQKNVLWDAEGNPWLIDWECVCRVNPTFDIVTTAMYWSGIASETYDQHLFIKMLDEYIKAGGKIDANLVSRSIDAAIGNWLNWLFYNTERAYSNTDSELRKTSIEQVKMVLGIIDRLENIILSISNYLQQ